MKRRALLAVAGALVSRADRCDPPPSRRITDLRVLVLAGHAVELRNVQRLRPFEATLGEHLQNRLDELRPVEAADRDEHRAGKTLETGGEESRAACRAKVAVEPFAGFRHVMK